VCVFDCAIHSLCSSIKSVKKVNVKR
jgi:hypothetical protein